MGAGNQDWNPCKEQQAFLIAEPCLQPFIYIFIWKMSGTCFAGLFLFLEVGSHYAGPVGLELAIYLDQVAL